MWVTVMASPSGFLYYFHIDFDSSFLITNLSGRRWGYDPHVSAHDHHLDSDCDGQVLVVYRAPVIVIFDDMEIQLAAPIHPQEVTSDSD